VIINERLRSIFVGENRGKILWKSGAGKNQNLVMKPIMTIPEVAEILEIATCTLRRYIRRRLIAVVILPGNDQRILEKDLKKFIDDRRNPDDSEGL